MSFMITPPNSSPLRACKKRDREEYEEDHSDYKRWQHTKIHSEVHNNTVEMMLRAQRTLQQQEACAPQAPESQDSESQDSEFTETCTYRQAPFWPVINRVRN